MADNRGGSAKGSVPSRLARITFAVLTTIACAATGVLAAKTPLRFMYWADPKADQKVWESVVAQFEKENPDISVKMTMVPNPEYFNKLLSMIAAGQAPDVCRHQQQSFEQFVKAGSMMNLTPYIKRDWRQAKYTDIYEKLIDMWVYNGKNYGVPFDYNVVLPAINRNLVKNAGLAPPDAGWKWDDFMAYARKMTKDANNDGKPEVYGAQIDTWFIFLETWVRGWGGQLIHDDGRRMGFDNPLTQKALEEAANCIQKYGVAPVSPGSGGISFELGKVGMLFSGHWAVPWLSTLKSSACDWEFYHMPGRADGSKTTIYGAGLCTVGTNTKHPDKAWRLASFFAGQYSQEAFSRVGVSLPVRTSMTKRVVTGTKEYDQKVFRDSFEQYAVKFPAPPKYTLVEQTMTPYTRNLLLGKQSVSQMIAAVGPALNKILASSK